MSLRPSVAVPRNCNAQGVCDNNRLPGVQFVLDIGGKFQKEGKGKMPVPDDRRVSPLKGRVDKPRRHQESVAKESRMAEYKNAVSSLEAMKTMLLNLERLKLMLARQRWSSRVVQTVLQFVLTTCVHLDRMGDQEIGVSGLSWNVQQNAMTIERTASVFINDAMGRFSTFEGGKVVMALRMAGREDVSWTLISPDQSAGRMANISVDVNKGCAADDELVEASLQMVSLRRQESADGQQSVLQSNAADGGTSDRSDPEEDDEDGGDNMSQDGE